MARQLWFLRPGEAEPHGAAGDDDRRLTQRGEGQSRAAGRALGALEITFQAVSPSPKARAVQTARLACEGLDTATEDNVSCCYAVQDKVWVDAPDGEPWEIYTVLADAEMPDGALRIVEPSGDAMCCADAPESAARCC